MRRFCYLPGGLTLVAIVFLSSCAQREEAPEVVPRPVTAIRLETVNPEQRLRLPGSVQAWQEQSFGFEVSGRVAWAIDEGEDVLGRILDKDGNIVQQGTVVARIDDTRHKLSVQIAEAQLLNAQAQAAATKVELEQILPHKLDAAKADLKNAQSDYDRVVKLFEGGTLSQAEKDQSEAQYKSAKAVVAQAEATFSATRAQLQALEASVLQAEESLESSNKDLADCTLYAPFDGRVATVDIAPGAYVSPGREAMKIVVMDPMKVEVPVSAATDRQIVIGDTVTIYPADLDAPRMGWVQLKDTIADAATRTFNIAILVRNQRIDIDTPADAPSDDLPRISDVGVIVSEMPEAPGPLMVDATAIQQDETGHFLWIIDNLNFRERGAEGARSPIFTVRKVPIQPGDRRRYLLTYEFRELADAGGLPELTPVLNNPPEGLKDGGQVIMIRRRWMFRPGDLVPVVLELPPAGQGLYVPMECILIQGDKRYVYMAGRQEIGESAAKRTEVRITGRFGELCRIEGDGIKEGGLVIMTGTHYLVDQELISVIEIKEAKDFLAAASISEDQP